MKITGAKVIVTCPGRNLVTLKIFTDEDLSGLGDATLNGREKAVVAYLEDHVIPCLIGRDPHRIEDIWQYLYKGAYWRRGPVTMTAIAAVDTALWDIKAKAAGLPLYQLLGGKSRDAVMVYCHANGADIAEAVDSVAAHMAQGYKAIRAQAGVPGLDKVYGVPKGGAPYEPAEKGLPVETVWSTEKYLDHAPKLFETLREKFGFCFHLLHDVQTYAAWNPGDQTTAGFSHVRNVDELREAAASHVIISVSEAVSRIRAGQVLNLSPLCGGMPPSVAWPYLQRVGEVVLPEALSKEASI